jgi:hypothetical protein
MCTNRRPFKTAKVETFSTFHVVFILGMKEYHQQIEGLLFFHFSTIYGRKNN